MLITWGLEPDSGSPFYGTWSSLSLGFETGADIRLGMLALGLRFAFDSGTLVEADDEWVDLAAATGAFSLRVGFAF